MNIGPYYNNRTGDFFSTLSLATDAAFVGDTISYKGEPFVVVSSSNRLDFV